MRFINNLRLDLADEDGFHICEMVGDGKIYVYYSEIDRLFKRAIEFRREHYEQ